MVGPRGGLKDGGGWSGVPGVGVGVPVWPDAGRVVGG